MKRIWMCTYLLAAQCVYCHGASSSQQEALHLKRITEYWKEGSYADAKKQILSFLSTYKESSVRDNLYAMLGDLYFNEDNMPIAIQYYEAIQQEKFQDKTRCKYITALSKLGQHAAVIKKAGSYFAKEQTLSAQESADIRYLLGESLFSEGRHMQDKAKLRSALSHYKELESTKYAQSVLAQQATIYKLLEQYPEASKLFLALAEITPERKEECLFHAASAQSHFDPELASQTFARVYALKGKMASDAAWSQLALLFQNENYKELVYTYSKTASYLTASRIQQSQFFLAKSNYELGNYEEAIPIFETYAQNTDSLPELRKTALLHLFNCAKQKQDLHLFDKTYDTFSSLYPDDTLNKTHIDLIHAEIALSTGNFSCAQDLLTKLSKEDLPKEQREIVLYDYALVLEKGHLWTAACENFLTFLQEFPGSVHTHSAWHHLVYASIEELSVADPSTSSAKKEELCLILTNLCKKPNFFSLDEQRDHTLLLAKLLCELENFSEARPFLTDYIDSYAEHASVADAHLLLAISYQNEEDQEPLFIKHIEKALELKANVHDKNQIYKKLFNTYVNKDPNKAAQYLFLAHIECNEPVRLENRLWLANHYYNLSSDPEMRARSIQVFEKIFDPKESHFENPLFEAEALKFCALLDAAHMPEKRLTILQKLYAAHMLNTAADWKHTKRTLFELAKAYETNQMPIEAIASYDALLASSLGYSSPISLAASLNKAKLQYTLLSEENRHADNIEIAAILDALKDVQIQKKVASEPLHIDAALTYVKIKKAITPKNARTEEMLLSLERLKADFTSDEYQNALALQPEKKELVELYLTFVEAHILHLQSKMALENHETTESAHLHIAALALIESLQGNKEKLPLNLKEGIEAFPQEVLSDEEI